MLNLSLFNGFYSKENLFSFLLYLTDEPFEATKIDLYIFRALWS